MSEPVRAVLVIAVLACVAFAALRSTFAGIGSAAQFDRRALLWFGITLAAFLAHNFWVFMAVAAVLLVLAASQEDDKLGMVLFIVLAVPLIRNEIPGFGPIRYFFELQYWRLIAIVVLLPLFLHAVADGKLRLRPAGRADWLLFAYVGLNIVLVFFASSLTYVMRQIFLAFIDTVLPYLLVSQLLRGRAIHAAVASFVVGATVLALIGMFEFAKGWLLYSGLEGAWGVPWSLGGYLRREDHVRAMATAGQAIPFGYTMAVAFIFVLGLRHWFTSRALWFGALCVLGGGAVAAYSRGPWIGLAAGCLVFVACGRQGVGTLLRLAILAVPLIALLAVSPIGESMLDAFFVESHNIDYRRRLLEVSIGVMLENPVFGAFNVVYSPAMQEMRQGRGLIDIVNTYLVIGLHSGFSGLILFVAFFVTIIAGLVGCLRRNPAMSERDMDLGRALLAALVCILVTIFTCSSISFIPIVYYCVAGLSMAYVRTIRGQTASVEKPAPQPSALGRAVRA